MDKKWHWTHQNHFWSIFSLEKLYEIWVTQYFVSPLHDLLLTHEYVRFLCFVSSHSPLHRVSPPLPYCDMFTTLCCLLLIMFYIGFYQIPADCACSCALFTHLILNILNPFIFQRNVWNTDREEGKEEGRTRSWEKTRVKGIDRGMVANMKVRDRKEMWMRERQGRTNRRKEGRMRMNEGGRHEKNRKRDGQGRVKHYNRLQEHRGQNNK